MRQRSIWGGKFGVLTSAPNGCIIYFVRRTICKFRMANDTVKWGIFYMYEDYIKTDEAAKMWNITPRRVQILCQQGKIDGAVRLGRDWMLPRDTLKPRDGRTKAGKAERSQGMSLPRKTSFLYMTDIYTVPGSADKVAEGLANNRKAQMLFEAEIAYSRGETDKVYESASYLFEKHSDFYGVVSSGMLLALCAIRKGDLELWRRAKIHIYEAGAESEDEREIITLAIIAVDSMLYDVKNFPDWFKRGCFEPLPKDSLGAAKVFYAKYLYGIAHSLAKGEFQYDGVKGLTLMNILPFTVEPMISQAKADGSIVVETYLRMTCAAIYYDSGSRERALEHLDRALSLALPDRLYGLIAEYCRILRPLIEMRLMQMDENIWHEVERLYKIYNAGWSRLNGSVSGKQIIDNLSDRYREIARLAAYKMSTAEIARRVNMSESGVKQAIKSISEKSGLDRSQFAAII